MELPIDLTLELDVAKVSAYRSHGQRVPGHLVINNTGSSAALQLQAVTSDYRWSVNLEEDAVTVGPGASARMPVTVDVPPDAWADHPVRISVRAFDNNGGEVETWREIDVDREIAPVNSTFGWRVPESLRGGLNVAWVPFGAQWVDPPSGPIDDVRDGQVYTGKRYGCCSAPRGWQDGYRPDFTLELPGNDLLPVAGLALNHFGTPAVLSDVRKGTLLVSADGQEFREVLRFETLTVETEQFFALPEPIPARYVRMRVDETFNARHGYGGLTLAEWKVILQPGIDLSGGTGFNIADPKFGGHIVADRPGRPYSPSGILNDKPSTHAVRLKPDQNQEYVIGFHHNRTAQIRRVEWIDDQDIDASNRFARVAVAVSTDSAVGPWQPIGELDLANAASGISMVALDTPVWARFVKLTAARNHTRPAPSPTAIRIWERPTSDDYRSVLAEWGYASPRGYFEQRSGLAPDPELAATDNNSRPTAAPLALETSVAGQVALGKREHWYRFVVPADQNTLTVTLTGNPTVRTRTTLEDAAGAPVLMRTVRQLTAPAAHVAVATVEPGADYFLKVEEPPRNVVFTWDTSSSVGPYLPTIYNSLVAFSNQVVPGQEAVNLMPYGRSALLRDWHGEPYVLQTILNDYPRQESSSAGELTVRRSSEILAPLSGTKAIVTITDGRVVHDAKMWDELTEVQPRIFGVHVGGVDAWNQDVFEDWASVNGGHYQQLNYAGGMEVAFDRAATLMRRPAGYTLSVKTEFREAPGPGSLMVQSGAGGASTGAGIELILDASGSMLQRMDGRRRITIAKEVMTEAVTSHIPAGTPVALRVFGHKEPDACRTDLEIPLAPLDPSSAAKSIESIQAMNLARTPIADSLAAVAGDLKGSEQRAVVVLITDGEETCDGDPAAVIEKLRSQGINVNLNIVGFAIGDPELEAQFATWAELGDGRYFSADSPQGLSSAIGQAVKVSYSVFDAAGSLVGRGEVDGESLELAEGVYRVVVNTVPGKVFDNVEVAGGSDVNLTLKK